MLPLRVLSAVLVGSMGGAPPASRDEVRVLLWTDSPAVAAELPTRIDARFVQADRAAFMADVDAAQAESEASTRTRQAEIDAALVVAREQWLAQQWAELDAGLATIERDHLDLLADPRRCETLWELELRRSLAARGKKDADEQDRRIALALALAPERRPAREVYGSEVTAQFAAAADARNARVPVSVALDVQPPHAVVHVDCQPVHTARLDLRPGLHVVHARAMGHESAAQIFVVPEDSRVQLALVADTSGDAVARLGRGLANGPLALQLPAHRRALVEAASARDIDVVVVVEAAGDAVIARALVGEGRGEAQRRPTALAAVASALATVGDDGKLGGTAITTTKPKPDAPPPKPKKPIVRAWWLWTSIAVVVAVGVGVGLGVGLKDRNNDRIVVYGPD